MNKVFWLQVSLLWAMVHFDMLMLRHVAVAKNYWEQETFGPLAYTIHYFGLDTAIWASRMVAFAFIVLVASVPRREWINRCLLLLNVLYASGLCDYLFVTGTLKMPGQA